MHRVMVSAAFLVSCILNLSLEPCIRRLSVSRQSLFHAVQLGVCSEDADAFNKALWCLRSSDVFHALHSSLVVRAKHTAPLKNPAHPQGLCRRLLILTLKFALDKLLYGK